MHQRDEDVPQESKPNEPNEPGESNETNETDRAEKPEGSRDLSDDFDTDDGALLVQPAAADIDALFGTASAGMPLVDAVGPSDGAQDHTGPLAKLSRRGKVLLIVGAGLVAVLAIVTFLALVRFD